MPTYQHLSLEKDPDAHIAKLTINRPDRRNAMNDQTTDEMADAIENVEADDSMRVLILTGAGNVFCAGGDLKALHGGNELGTWAADSPEEIRRSFRRAQRLMLGLQRMEKPVIGMINGAAVGAGFDLAAVCDIRIGCPRSRFMVGYVRLGLFPGFGGTWLYTRTLGSLGKAAKLLFTGDFLEADEAYRVGFLNRVVPEDDLESATMEMARKIGDGPPIALRLAKLMLYKGLDFDLETAMKMAAAAETITLRSKDHEEGIAAFRASRKPVYEGR